MKLKEKFQRFWTLSKSHKGFTLVELIVVIAILAILAGVAIPVYNGYIKKAQEAADQQLLDTINTAFAAACLTNGMDHVKAVAQISVDEDGLICEPKQTLSAAPAAAGYDYFLTVTYPGKGNVTTVVVDSFAIFFAGNENAAFKGEKYVGKTLRLDAEGNFTAEEVVEYEYNGTKVTISTAAIEAFKKSNWGILASADVLSLVGNVSDMATAIDSDTFLNMLEDPAYLSASAAVLGWTADDYDDKFTAMLEDAGAAWLEKNPDGDVEAYMETLGSQMIANNAILVAAKGAETTGSGIIDLLTTNGGKDAKTTIAANMGKDPSAGLSQAALAYGLYTSYMLEKDPENFDVNAPMDFSAVLNTMDDADFQNYLTEGNGQQDLDGYLAALGTVSGNSGIGGIGTDVLVNGFDNTELVALLQQAMGK